MRFVDSNVLAYAFYENEQRERCQECVRSGGVINTLSLIEAAHVLEKITNDKKRVVRAIRSLLRSNLTIVNLDVNLTFEVTKKQTPLNFFDAVHYFCAKQQGCDSIVSYDKDFDKVDIKREVP